MRQRRYFVASCSLARIVLVTGGASDLFHHYGSGFDDEA
jgi:hypothetical protein